MPRTHHCTEWLEQFTLEVMFKTGAIILVGIGVALVVSGVVEVKFHHDRLKDVPSKLLDLVPTKEALEQGKTTLVNLKRWVELAVVREDAQRLKIAFTHVQEDTTKLKQLIEDQSAPTERLVAQAKLLVASLEYVTELGGKVPTEVLKKTRDESKDTLTSARQVLDKLSKQQERFATYGAQLSWITESLEKYFGSFTKNEEGKRDTDTASPPPASFELESVSPLPLRF